MKKFVAFAIASVLAVLLSVSTEAFDACSDADSAIQGYGIQLSEATSAWNNAWNLLEYQINTGSVVVGDSSWENSTYLLGVYQSAINDAVAMIEFQLDYKRTMGCPV